MKIYCLESFKDEIEKLKKKNSYSGIEKEIIEHFFDKTLEEIRPGINLNQSEDNPIIKKRLNGSGGFRCYFLLIVKGDCLYLMYVHPKSGTLGFENITKEFRATLFKKVFASIKTNDVYEVNTDSTQTKLIFKKKGNKVPELTK